MFTASILSRGRAPEAPYQNSAGSLLAGADGPDSSAGFLDKHRLSGGGGKRAEGSTVSRRRCRGSEIVMCGAVCAMFDTA